METEQVQGPVERIRGRVVWFENGMGFIRPKGWDADIFCHFSQIEMDGYKNLEEGQIVEFEVGKYNNKVQANNIVVVGEGNNGNS